MGSRVGVVGAGYVGLTSAACLAHLGHHVVCADNDESKVDELNRGEVRIAEPGLAELVHEGLAEGRLAFATELAALAESELVLLCLPTPMGEGGGADLRVLEAVLADIAPLLPSGCVLVTKSTVPVGTAARIPGLLGRTDLPVVSNPEFLREGHAVGDFLHPDRVVVGALPAEADALARVADLYAGTGAPVLRTEPASAEMAKYASNAFLAVKASYVNVLADLCERLGADITEVTRTMGLDNRIGPGFLSPGPGWGGSCLPKDTSALLRLAETAGVDFALVRDAVKVNARQRAFVVRKVRHAATGRADGSLAGVRIGLLGLAFKAGTGDLRESPAVAIARDLTRQGALLTAYDPCVEALDQPCEALQVVDDPYLVAKDAVALVILTEWPEFKELDWARLASATEKATVVDTRNLLGEDELAGSGFTRWSIGSPACP